MTETELEEQLSRPTEADNAYAAALEGDLLMLGAGGKMGTEPGASCETCGHRRGPNTRVIAVSRSPIAADGVETIACDLLEPGALARLPEAKNVIFMAARKFGTCGSEHLTWAMNTYLPGLVAERYRESRIVAFSSGNVYGVTPVASGGSTEDSAVSPVGEYAQSVLGRERIFEYGSHRWGTQIALLRLNYAVELRYGVLVDIARAVFTQAPVDLRMGYVNCIWQRDANAICAAIFIAVLESAGDSEPDRAGDAFDAMDREEFGKRFGIEPVFRGEEHPNALLNNAARSHELFGLPTVSPDELIDWIATWVSHGNTLLNKPTHFDVQDGKF